VENLNVADELKKLFGYLIDRGCVEQLNNYNEECLSVFSRDVLGMIAVGDSLWETMVPAEVAEVIKSQGYFGYKDQQESH
jgi:hypothetical protein